MAENKMKQVAEMLGVEMYKPFKIKGNKIIECYNPYTLTKNGLYDKEGVHCLSILHYLLIGANEIEKTILNEKEKNYMNKEKLMKDLLDLYEQYKFYPNEIVKSYKEKLEKQLKELL